ncbi:MAG: molybdopterin-dependent oxidoreductase [Acidimicrobiales bacterium]
MDGEPLPPEHGFPARLVVPGLYGYVSATKWLSEIRVTTWDEEGFWIPAGGRLGPIKIASRIDVHTPVPSSRPAPWPSPAWRGRPMARISKVEVRIDEGVA